MHVPVDFKEVQCPLSILRNGHVALSNLRVKGPSLGLRSQREGRAVRGVDLGQLCNHCLPGSSVALGGGGGGGILCDAE